MSRTAEWLKNLFHLFSVHDQPAAIARVDKDAAKLDEGKERKSGGDGGGSGGYKVVAQKTAPSPFSESGGGGF